MVNGQYMDPFGQNCLLRCVGRGGLHRQGEIGIEIHYRVVCKNGLGIVEVDAVRKA